DRYVVRAKVGHDYVFAVGSKRGNERPRLDIRVLRADEHARDLGISSCHPCEIDVDDRDCVTFESDLLTFSIRSDDPSPVGTRSDTPGADLSGNADNLRRLIAGQRLLEIDHRHVIGAPVGGEQVMLAIAAAAESDAVRVREASPGRVRREQRNRGEGAVGLGKGLLERWRAARRDERNGKSRAWKPGITE